MIDYGFLKGNGRARCGACTVTEDRTPGGKGERKADGWRYDPVLGWLCRWCAHWSRRNGRDVDNSPRIVDNSAVVDDSQRFRSDSGLSPARFTPAPPRWMRARRRHEIRKLRRREAKERGTYVLPVGYSSSQRIKWAKQKRATARARREEPEPQP